MSGESSPLSDLPSNTPPPPSPPEAVQQPTHRPPATIIDNDDARERAENTGNVVRLEDVVAGMYWVDADSQLLVDRFHAISSAGRSTAPLVGRSGPAFHREPNPLHETKMAALLAKIQPHVIHPYTRAHVTLVGSRVLEGIVHNSFAENPSELLRTLHRVLVEEHGKSRAITAQRRGNKQAPSLAKRTTTSSQRERAGVVTFRIDLVDDAAQQPGHDNDGHNERDSVDIADDGNNTVVILQDVTVFQTSVANTRMNMSPVYFPPSPNADLSHLASSEPHDLELLSLNDAISRVRQLREHGVASTSQHNVDHPEGASKKATPLEGIVWQGQLLGPQDPETPEPGPVIIVVARFSRSIKLKRQATQHLLNQVVFHDWQTQRRAEEAADDRLVRYPPPSDVFSVILSGVSASGAIPTYSQPTMNVGHRQLAQELDRISQLQPPPEVHFLVRGVSGFSVRSLAYEALSQKWPNLNFKITFAMRDNYVRDMNALDTNRRRIDSWLSAGSQLGKFYYTDYYDVARITRVQRTNVKDPVYNELIRRFEEDEKARNGQMSTIRKWVVDRRASTRNDFG